MTMFEAAHNLTFDSTSVERERLRDRAPGLDARLVDNLLRDAWVKGYWEGRNEAYDMGKSVGVEHGRQQARKTFDALIERVIRGRLNHVVLGLTEVAQRRNRTTIAAEREWMASKATDVRAAIDALQHD